MRGREPEIASRCGGSAGARRLEARREGADDGRHPANAPGARVSEREVAERQCGHLLSVHVGSLPSYIFERRKARDCSGTVTVRAKQPLSPQTIELPALPLGRPAASALAHGGRGIVRRHRWAVVDDALRGSRSPDPLAKDLHDFDVPLPTVDACFDAVTRAHSRSSLRRAAVDADVATPAGLGCGRSRLEEADGPQPLVDPRRVHVDDPATVGSGVWRAAVRVDQ